MPIERDSNIELLRLLAMLMVVLVHCNYFSLGEINAHDVVTDPGSSWWRILGEQTCIVGVNVFVMISGWFGIRPTMKGAGNIIFQVFFYGIVLFAVGLFFGMPVSKTEVWQVFYFGSYYWFVLAYLVLYAFSPVLNTFIKYSSHSQQLFVIVAFFALEFLFGWVVNISTYEKGYSAISFFGLYLLARFAHENQDLLPTWSCWRCFSLYFVLTLMPAVTAFLGLKFVGRAFCAVFYSSPFVIAASAFLLLAFTKLDFKSRIINWAAASVFSIYLVHQHPVVVPVFISTMKHAYANMSGLLYVLFVIGVSLLIGAVCVVFDKVRIAIWNFLCKHGLDNFFGKVSSITQRL